MAEARLESPYDPDFESEEYYEHENRLQIDDNYAEAFRINRERRSHVEDREREVGKENWVRYWLQALNECPNGPTLFYPPAGQNVRCKLAKVPPFLFRTFDDQSSGKSDNHVVASFRATSVSDKTCRTDLLAMRTEAAAEMLYGHLTKPCFGGTGADNLMSWSSSLLFVIQYAI